ncbi:MAG: hypothetical protein K2X77_33405 [Candidatus Obscuribacterales bacterium]|nr:hypothetical protein [Candidatus Obscuribacterales bacterium]
MEFWFSIFSILAGLGAGFAFCTKQAATWRQQRTLTWAMAAIVVLVCTVASFIFGGELMLAAVAFLAFTVYGSFKNDAEYSRALAKDSIETGKSFVGVAREAAIPLLAKLRFRTSSIPVRTTVSHPAIVPARKAPVSPAPAPVVQAEPMQEPAPAAPAKTELSEEEVLQQLLVEIGRLQQWTARPEAERTALVHLSADVRSTEAALNEAVLQLRTGTVNWNKICEHVAGLKQHDLPETLSQSLDALVSERAGKLDETRKTVDDVSGKLRQSSGELKAKLETPVLSPEDVIEAANDAIETADAVTAEARKRSS